MKGFQLLLERQIYIAFSPQSILNNGYFKVD